MFRATTRKEFLKQTFGGLSLAAAGGLTSSCRQAEQPARPAGAGEPPLDVLIRNGRVIDGTGKPWFPASVAVRDGKIVDIGKLDGASARQVIDATGQYVCPGFIDPHAHEEIMMLSDPVEEKFIRQGVTTLVNGNCGHSVTPYAAAKVLEYHWREALISKRRSQMDVQWDGVASYAELIAARGGTGINSAVLLGYGGIRWGAMKGGHDRPPTDEEWKEIERLVREGLEQGAVGLSTGLSYKPCSYAPTDELVRVAKILGAFDRTYATHTRSGSEGDPTGGLEAIRIGEQAGCRVQISHFASRFKGALDMVSDAHRRGLEIAADVIPQSVSHRRASNRMIEALMVFYPGAFDFTEGQLKDLLNDPEKRAEITGKISFFNNDKANVVIVRALTPKHEADVGRSIEELAAAQGKDPNDLYVELVLDEANPVVFTFDGNRREARRDPDDRLVKRYGEGNVAPAGFWTTHRLFGPGSDSLPVDPDEPYGWYEHQRRGAFVGYLTQARAQEVPLEAAIMRATSLPAQQFRLLDRGLISTGKAADLMVFNPDAYSFPSPAESDVNDPFPLASGVSAVLVNGATVLADGQLTGARSGRVLG